MAKRNIVSIRFLLCNAVLGIASMLLAFNCTYAADIEEKKTIITVMEKEFKIDGKGEKQKNFN
ncbi:hypothetical protein [Legionella tunisiensis]|uniref:hypothetical protein n=1 Tax=Legionella tunisiensis TaxID=1034944 RepID=UPI00037232F1|nr:hypothetical protein [Legionella tunisiensis]